MRNALSQQMTVEKAARAWIGGCNSMRSQWLIGDNQYRWGVNIVNRGGIIQTRPGRRLRLSLPLGDKLQGLSSFRCNKLGAANDGKTFLVAAVDGFIYAVPFNTDGTITQPPNWNSFRLTNITFLASASEIIMANAQQSSSSTTVGTLAVVATHNILMFQDGTTAAAFWDGEINRHTVQDSPDFETPTATSMAYSGNRLWLGQGTSVIASDLSDPTKFLERTQGGGGVGDYRFEFEVTALSNSVGDNRRGVLLVFTNQNVNALQSSILNRDDWATTANFQTVVLPSIGCIARKSVVNHSGLIWWYSPNGLVNIDAATTSFLTSEIKIRDIEMAYSKRNFAPDLSVIASASFENYLLVSVPSGDPFNAHTMVLDYAVANEFGGSPVPPAWNGVWTGTRPVEWAKATVNGVDRVFQASVDYQSLNGTFFHIWEEFQPNRADTYELADQVNGANVSNIINNQIYCSFESKLIGDGMDLKKYAYAQIQLCEVGGIINLRIAAAGTKGGYFNIFSKKIIANMDADGITDPKVRQLYADIGPFRVQSRHINTQDVRPYNSIVNAFEAPYENQIDTQFSHYFQWCGRMGIQTFRFFTQETPEKSEGSCEEDETGINIETVDGKTLHLDQSVDSSFVQSTDNNSTVSANSISTFLGAETPRYREVFYSSIPVDWSDLPMDCITCLPCARDTFEPPTSPKITINGQVLN